MEREELAKEAVYKYLKKDLNLDVRKEDLHLTWFSKMLKNWKALVILGGDNGLYFEVTYNGETEEIYLDVYDKRVKVVMV